MFPLILAECVRRNFLVCKECFLIYILWASKKELKSNYFLNLRLNLANFNAIYTVLKFVVRTISFFVHY